MNDKGQLIALCGAKGSGKTLLSEYIVGEMGFQRISFAQPLRDMLEAIGVGEHYHTENKTKPVETISGKPTARYMLQTLGTEWGRNTIHPDIWCNIAVDRMLEAVNSGYNVIVDDMRFPNEFEAVKYAGGQTLKICRKTAEGADTHESEVHWKTMDCDLDVDNNGSINSSINQIKGFLKEL